MPQGNLYGMDSTKFVALVAAFDQARRGSPAKLKELGKGIDLPGFSIDEVIADITGPKAGRAFRAMADGTCRGEESLAGCDVKAVRDALARLLKSPSNGCDAASVDKFLPPVYDGSQTGKGKLGAISWLSKVVHRGSPCAGSGVPFYIENPEVPELFGELSPTEVKYDGTPDSKLVRRFYDFIEAMMIVGEGGYQLEEE